VLVPEGKIAQGKLAQAVMHGARVISLRGNFDEALELVKQIVERWALRPTPWRYRSGTPATSPPGGKDSRSTGAVSRGSTDSRPRVPLR
jgi:hypothetical protein